MPDEYTFSDKFYDTEHGRGFTLHRGRNLAPGNFVVQGFGATDRDAARNALQIATKSGMAADVIQHIKDVLRPLDGQ